MAAIETLALRQVSRITRESIVEHHPSRAGSLAETHGDDIERLLVRLVGGQKRVLVVGHGTSSLSRSLAGAGCEVSMAEIGSGGVAAGPAARPRDESDDAPLMTPRRSGQRFETIAALGLLERAHDPITLLGRLGQHLTREGCVVAAVPNITHARHRLALLGGRPPTGVEPWQAASPCRFYDADALTQLFERSGFAITQFERVTERVDCAATSVGDVSVSRELLDDVLRDPDAQTSAFIVVGHKRPLPRSLVLDLRVRDLTQAHEAQRAGLERIERAQHALHEGLDAARHAQRERSDVLERRQDALSVELQDVRRMVDTAHQSTPSLSQPLLRKAHDGLVRRTADVDSIGRTLTRLRYEQQIVRIRATVEATIPTGSTVLVVSKGDPRLLEFDGRVGWHFLQAEDGRYAGYHPGDSSVAIAALDQLRRKGAGYLLFPRTAFWWLDHYATFASYLDEHCTAIVRDERSCVIYALERDRAPR